MPRGTGQLSKHMRSEARQHAEGRVQASRCEDEAGSPMLIPTPKRA